MNETKNKDENRPTTSGRQAKFNRNYQNRLLLPEFPMV